MKAKQPGPSLKSAIVAGSGIVGLTCAHRLIRAGVATSVIGPAAGASASWGNAGHLALEQAEPLASGKSMRKAFGQMFGGGGAIRAPVGEIGHWLPFFLRVAGACRKSRFRAGTGALTSCMQRAAPAWRALLAEIGHPQLLLERGHFVLWESTRSAIAGRARWGSAETGPASFAEATAEELERLESLIRRRICGALRFEQTGQFTDPGVLLDKLEGSILTAGASRVDGLATGIHCDKRRRRAVVETADGARHEADAIVVAAGVASGKLLASAGIFAPIIAERGYHIHAPTDHWPDGVPPLVFEDRSLIVTRFTSGLRASGFVEFARPERPPDATLWRALQAHAAELGLPFDRPLTRFMGARPTLPDYLPAIGRSPEADNLYYAFGHQHLGLTLAALTAELIRDLVLGERPAIDLRPFSLGRFAASRQAAPEKRRINRR
jgi:D-amino-acid dehydrogenase